MDLPTLNIFLGDHGGEERQRFLARFTEPFLLVDLPGTRSPWCEFGTVLLSHDEVHANGGENDRLRSLTSLVYVLAKTSRNQFNNMITLGRAHNNDVVIANKSVSKFHAFFKKDPNTGRLSIHDGGSSFGTKVNGKDVDKVTGHLLSSEDTILFASAVQATFYSPGELFDYLQVLKRGGVVRTG
jgi:hypothetical protein